MSPDKVNHGGGEGHLFLVYQDRFPVRELPVFRRLYDSYKRSGGGLKVRGGAGWTHSSRLPWPSLIHSAWLNQLTTCAARQTDAFRVPAEMKSEGINQVIDKHAEVKPPLLFFPTPAGQSRQSMTHFNIFMKKSS